MSEWPEHSAELGRKSISQMTKIVWLMGEGKLRPPIAAFTLNSLCDTIQGLVSNEDFDLIYAALKEIRREIRDAKSKKQAQGG